MKAITAVVTVIGWFCGVAIAEAPKATPGKAAQAKVTILSTMLSGVPGRGIGEWGFAALVEVDGRRILFDTGARPETVLKNAEEMKIDLAGIEDVVLSHWHDDHTGGLLKLREELRKKDPKSLSRAHVGKEFFAQRVVKGTDVTRVEEMRKAYVAMGGKFVEHAKAGEIAPGVWLTGPVPRKHPERNWSGSAQIRRGKDVVEDNLPEDSSLVIDTAQGLIVITGCGHAGVVNIVEYSRAVRGGAKVHAIIGGLHLLELTDDKLAWTAKELKTSGVAHVIGAHCTGIEAVFRLREGLGLARATAVVGMVGASFTLGKGIDPLGLAK